jgi:hypothetical protein
MSPTTRRELDRVAAKLLINHLSPTAADDTDIKKAGRSGKKAASSGSEDEDEDLLVMDDDEEEPPSDEVRRPGATIRLLPSASSLASSHLTARVTLAVLG